MLFKITAAFRKASDITPQKLKELGIKGLILDLDNTLTTHDNPVPSDGILEWLDCMKKNNIRLMIVSNNHPPRVKPFADMLGLDFVSEGRKPLIQRFQRGKPENESSEKSACCRRRSDLYGRSRSKSLWHKNALCSADRADKTNFFKLKSKGKTVSSKEFLRS